MMFKQKMSEFVQRVKNVGRNAGDIAPALLDTADGLAMVTLSSAAMDRVSRNCVVGGFVATAVGVVTGIKAVAVVGVGAMTFGFVKGFREAWNIVKISDGVVIHAEPMSGHVVDVKEGE